MLQASPDLIWGPLAAPPHFLHGPGCVGSSFLPVASSEAPHPRIPGALLSRHTHLQSWSSCPHPGVLVLSNDTWARLACWIPQCQGTGPYCLRHPQAGLTPLSLCLLQELTFSKLPFLGELRRCLSDVTCECLLSPGCRVDRVLSFPGAERCSSDPTPL